MDFLEKLKMLLGGKAKEPAPAPEGKPWETPLSTVPGVPMHRMPDGSMMEGASHPAGGPAGSGNDIDAQVQRLMMQREIAKRLLPQEIWNK